MTTPSFPSVEATTIDAFIRDDDGGWDDDRLHALLDVTQRAGVTVDVAMIPSAVSAPLADALAARMAQGGVGVHQHGLAHANHETTGRKCEFGARRDVTTQARDIAQGCELMRAHFGDRALPVFTPPWNRLAVFTPSLLATQGFTTLSRDRGARPEQRALQELAIDIDWTKCWREGGEVAVHAAVAFARRRCAALREPLGLMLHHAVMEPAELDALPRVLAQAGVTWRSMAAFVTGPQTGRMSSRGNRWAAA